MKRPTFRRYAILLPTGERITTAVDRAEVRLRYPHALAIRATGERIPRVPS
ncbi:hypothetical protein [Salinisphaera sp. T31B1]|uniref:hypothetical protein n=1 Tax=Salinisphaera sp. T31B1 TaxID=727963 RepID=UPI00333ECA1F